MEISLGILDTNFDYPGMRKIAIASANAFMLVFAVNDVASFKQVLMISVEIHHILCTVRNFVHKKKSEKFFFFIFRNSQNYNFR